MTKQVLESSNRDLLTPDKFLAGVQYSRFCNCLKANSDMIVQIISTGLNINDKITCLKNF